MADDANIPEDLRAALAHMDWRENPTARRDLEWLPAAVADRPEIGGDRQCKGVQITTGAPDDEEFAVSVLLLSCRRDPAFPGEIIGSWSGDVDGFHVIEVWAQGAPLPVLPEPHNPMAA